MQRPRCKRSFRVRSCALLASVLCVVFALAMLAGVLPATTSARGLCACRLFAFRETALRWPLFLPMKGWSAIFSERALCTRPGSAAAGEH